MYCSHMYKIPLQKYSCTVFQYMDVKQIYIYIYISKVALRTERQEWGERISRQKLHTFWILNNMNILLTKNTN